MTTNMNLSATIAPTNGMPSAVFYFTQARSVLKRGILTLTLLLLVFGTRAAYAQGVNSSGTDFWVGFMPNYVGGRNVTQLFLASGTNNTVKVTVGSSTKTYTLGPNIGITADLSGLGVTRIPETPSTNSVHVTSSAPLTMYGYNVWDGGSGFIGGSPDGYLSIPTSALGTEYYTVNYYDATFGGTPVSGEYVIIAPYDNTLVTITTAAHTKNATGGTSHNPGETWSVVLMKGQTYLVQSTAKYIGEDDLTGSHIVSNKPVALISGHQISPIDISMSSADHLAEMVPPLDKWGTQYFDMPMAGRTKCGDYIRIISGENGNSITYNGKGPFLLDAGQWVELAENTEPTVFTSTVHKKFIVAQYSYSLGFDNDPSTNADPFMILFTPQEEFEKRMIFRSPLAANNGSFVNYLTVISNKDSLLKIQINGKPILGAYKAIGQQSFPGTNMAAVRVQLPNGSNTFLATSNSPFGAYQYGFAYYEGYGWPTGSALNIQSPDTLPPLQTYTSACGTYNVHLMEDRHIPAFSFEDTRIAEVDFITEQNDPRWSKPSYNYVFTLDPAFNPGDSTANFNLSIINPLQDAYAAIFTVDKAGNDTVYEYTYSAPKITFNPAPPYSFGNVLVASDSCQTVTVTNHSTNDVLLRSISILGMAQHGSYTLTPANTNTTLKGGDSTKFTICFSPSDTGVKNLSIDSITVGIGSCDSVRFGMSGQGVTPLIYATDVNFGVVDSGKTNCMPLTITNKGTSTLVITKQNLLNTVDFTVTASQPLPIYLAPGHSITLDACFHPTHTGSFSTTDLFSTLNPAQFARSIKDTSNLIGSAQSSGARLTSYLETYTATCGQKPLIIDTVYDPDPLATQIDSVSITGADASSFSILGFSPGNGTYPVPLDKAPSPGIAYRIQFDPTVKGMLSGVRSAIFNVYAGKVHLPATLSANSKEPVLATTPTLGTVLNLGTTLVGQQLTTTFTIQNTGNDVLNISTITIGGPSAASFTATPSGPFVIPAGGTSPTITITYTAGASATNDSAFVNVTPDPVLSTCAIAGGLPIIASSNSTGYTVQTNDYPTIFTCKNSDTSGRFTNTSSFASDTLQSVSIVGANASDFQILTLPSFPVIVPPGKFVPISIRFTPTAIGLRTAQVEFVFQTSTRTVDTLLTITGTGANIQETVGAGSTTAVQAYSGHANDPISVPIIMSNPFNAAGTNEVYGYEFKVSFHEDAFNLANLVWPAGITGVEGTPVVDPATHIATIDFKGTSGNPLTTETTLLTLNMVVMLDTGSSTAIVPSGVTFFDKSGQSVCYIASSNVNGTFNFQANCGDNTIQNVMKGNTTVLSLALPEPNPFKTSTTIGFSVNEPVANVTIAVYDELGNAVSTLLSNEQLKQGAYSTVFDGSKLSSGSYFIRISDGTNIATRRILLTK